MTNGPTLTGTTQYIPVVFMICWNVNTIIPATQKLVTIIVNKSLIGIKSDLNIVIKCINKLRI